MNRVCKELLPKAQVATINRVAGVVHSRSIRNVKSMFTIRNVYTERSIRFSPAKVRSSGVAGYAITGSISPYLDIQEKGGTVRAKRKYIVGPTEFSRGGSHGSPIKRKYRLPKMGSIATRKGGGRMQPAGAKFFILRPGRKSSGYNVRAKSRYRLRQSAIFTRDRGKLIKVRYLRKKSYRLKATHWHTEAVKKYGNKRVMGQVFVQEAKKQLGRVR